jgi:hypothetical protein
MPPDPPTRALITAYWISVAPRVSHVALVVGMNQPIRHMAGTILDPSGISYTLHATRPQALGEVRRRQTGAAEPSNRDDPRRTGS